MNDEIINPLIDEIRNILNTSKRNIAREVNNCIFRKLISDIEQLQILQWSK